MHFIEATILGFLQGLTEFLPVSSSAHLRIAGELLPSGADPGATFTAITQLGTEAAVLVYFWKDITRIAGKWFRHFRPAKEEAEAIPKNDPDVRMGWLIILGSIPIVVAGYLLQDVIRTSFRSLWITAVVLIVFGLLLGAADLLGRKEKELDDLTYRDGILFGLAQMLALVPGVSRSGATTTLGRAIGYQRPAVARYSFLLAVPAVFGSGLYELYHSISEPQADPPFGYLETGIATGVSFGVGLAVIAFLMNYIKTRSFLPFVVYRVGLGGVLLALLSTGAIDPL